jgi:hypothetical protein
LAKDSIKQLFDKDYNWLCVIYGGLMKAKIRNEMIEEVSFFDSLSSYCHIIPINMDNPGRTVLGPGGATLLHQKQHEDAIGFTPGFGIGTLQNIGVPRRAGWASKSMFCNVPTWRADHSAWVTP